MARTPRRRLKVFQAHLGFYETIVAAPSRAAALRAWGTSQDLFATGQASVTEEATAVELATAQPETVLKRPVGSAAAFERDPKGLPDLPSAPARPAAAKPAPPPKPAADRTALTGAEQDLAALDQRRKAAEAAFRARLEAIEAEKAAAQAAYVRDRQAASAAVVAARHAYRQAGGRD